MSIGILPARLSGRLLREIHAISIWDRAASLLLLMVLSGLVFWRPGFPLDDAYITLHNARTLLAGGADPSYSGANALTGATSAVHLVLIAALGLVLPLELASKLVSLAAIALYAAGLSKLLRRTNATASTRAVLLCSGLLVAYLPYQLLNGLETGLAMAAVTWALALSDSRWLPMICGTLPFVRPELAFLSVPLFARYCWNRRGKPNAVATAILLGIAAALPWALLYLTYTGSPFPNTGSAKVFFFAEASEPLSVRAQVFFAALGYSLIGPLFVGLLGLRFTPIGWCCLAFLIAWLGTALVTLPGGLMHNWFRYCSLMIPILLLGWAELTSRFPAYARIALLLVGGWSFITGLAGLAIYLDTSDVAARQKMVDDAVQNVPADAVIMIHDAGYIAWAAPHFRLVDAVGLKSPARTDWGQAVAATEKTRADFVVRTAATSGLTYFIGLDADPFWGKLGSYLTQSGWKMDRLAGSGTDYSLYRLSPPQRTKSKESA